MRDFLFEIKNPTMQDIITNKAPPPKGKYIKDAFSKKTLSLQTVPSKDLI